MHRTPRRRARLTPATSPTRRDCNTAPLPSAQTFAFTAAAQSYAVPACVTRLRIEASGAPARWASVTTVDRTSRRSATTATAAPTAAAVATTRRRQRGGYCGGGGGGGGSSWVGTLIGTSFGAGDRVGDGVAVITPLSTDQ